MITTQSGTYTIEQYKQIENKIKKLYKDYWKGKLTGAELQEKLNKSGLSYAELKGMQYQASIEEE